MSTTPDPRGRLRARTITGQGYDYDTATDTASEVFDLYQQFNPTAAIEQTTVQLHHAHEVGPREKRYTTTITIVYRDPQEDHDDDEITSTYYDRTLDDLSPSESEERCEIENRQAQRDQSYLRTYYDEIHEYPKAGQR